MPTLKVWVRSVVERWRTVRRVDAELLGGSVGPRWLLPGLVVGLAAIEALFRLGIDDLYTESILFLGLAFAVGILSRSLGMVLVGSHVAFDLVTTWRGDLFGQLEIRMLAGRVVAAWVLGLLVITIAGAVRSAAAFGQSQGRRWIRPELVAGFTAGALTWMWSAAAPYLVRPAFRFTPVVDAISPLQEQKWILVAVMAAIAAAAIWLIRLRGRLLADPIIISGWFYPSARFSARIGRLVLGLILLMGLITSWLDIVLLAGGVLLAEVAGRAIARNEHLGVLRERVPLTGRYALAFIVSWGASRLIMGAVYRPVGSSEFFPLVISIPIAYLVFQVLVGSETRPAVAPPSAVGVVIVFVAWWVLTDAPPAFADNCSGLNDCDRAGGATVAAAGASIAAAIWGWVKGWGARMPPVIGQLEPLLSKEGAAAQRGLAEALKEKFAKDRLAETGDTEEYYRIREMPLDEFLETYAPDWYQ